MAQIYTVNCFQADHTGMSDLQNIENNFAALKSSFSGTVAPSVSIEKGQLWYDTSNKILRVLNYAGNEWLGVMYGNASSKIWIYTNSATDGWTIDSSVTDAILALKGGSQVYNTNGGSTAGTWTQPSHTLTVNELPSHDHNGVTGYDRPMHTHSFSHSVKAGNTGSSGSYGNNLMGGINSSDTSVSIQSDGGYHRHTVSSEGGGSSHNHGSSYRPRAAVGTMQYPSV